MPIKPCSENGSPGFKWGDQGKCYTYTAGDKSSRQAAHAKAARQGRAAKANNISNEENAIRHGIDFAIGQLGTEDTINGYLMGVEDALHILYSNEEFQNDREVREALVFIRKDFEEDAA